MSACFIGAHSNLSLAGHGLWDNSLRVIFSHFKFSLLPVNGGIPGLCRPQWTAHGCVRLHCGCRGSKDLFLPVVVASIQQPTENARHKVQGGHAHCLDASNVQVRLVHYARCFTWAGNLVPYAAGCPALISLGMCTTEHAHFISGDITGTCMLI